MLGVKLQPIVCAAIGHVEYMCRAAAVHFRVTQPDFSNRNFPAVFSPELNRFAHRPAGAEECYNIDLLIQDLIIIHQKVLDYVFSRNDSFRLFARSFARF